MFKTRLDSYGNDFGFVWNFGKFLIFLKIFEDSTLHGTLGKKFFEKKYPKTCSKHVWTFLGTILGSSEIFKSFWFFWKFSTTWLSKEHWVKKKIFGKIASKHVQHTFGHFWERFRAFLQFLKIFDFFENFRQLDSLRNTGKKFFEKKYPKTCSTHVWTFLGTGFSAILKSFWFFWKFSTTRLSKEHWAKKTFSGKSPQNMFNTCLDTFGNDFGHFCKF